MLRYNILARNEIFNVNINLAKRISNSFRIKSVKARYCPQTQMRMLFYQSYLGMHCLPRH